MNATDPFSIIDCTSALPDPAFVNGAWVVTQEPLAPSNADFNPNYYIQDTSALNNPSHSGVNGINKYICATASCAAKILARMNMLGFHPTPTMDYPDPGYAGNARFAQGGPNGGKVPYLDFTQPDGTIDHENVGGIAQEYLIFPAAFVDSVCVNSWYKGDQ